MQFPTSLKQSHSFLLQYKEYYFGWQRFLLSVTKVFHIIILLHLCLWTVRNWQYYWEVPSFREKLPTAVLPSLLYRGERVSSNTDVNIANSCEGWAIFSPGLGICTWAPGIKPTLLYPVSCQHGVVSNYQHSWFFVGEEDSCVLRIMNTDFWPLLIYTLRDAGFVFGTATPDFLFLDMKFPHYYQYVSISKNIEFGIISVFSHIFWEFCNTFPIDKAAMTVYASAWYLHKRQKTREYRGWYVWIKTTKTMKVVQRNQFRILPIHSYRNSLKK